MCCAERIDHTLGQCPFSELVNTDRDKCFYCLAPAAVAVESGECRGMLCEARGQSAPISPNFE